jgi:hypothetical protein
VNSGNSASPIVPNSLLSEGLSRELPSYRRLDFTFPVCAFLSRIALMSPVALLGLAKGTQSIEHRGDGRMEGISQRDWLGDYMNCFWRGFQRFARVAIAPRPSKRWSEVTRVRPSTSAVAAKKRSAGSWCGSGSFCAATTIS